MARIKIDYTKELFNVISLGAGKQSSMMLLMALENKFEFSPDMAVFADTGNEPDYVYSHLNWLKEYVWGKYRFPIAVVTAGNIVKDVENHVKGLTTWSPTPPLWYSGNGFLRRQCTSHLKIRAIRKAARKQNNFRQIRMWIGISYDEIERMKKSNVKYIVHYYPFVENKISLQLIKKMYQLIGVPEPGNPLVLYVLFIPILLVTPKNC